MGNKDGRGKGRAAWAPALLLLALAGSLPALALAKEEALSSGAETPGARSVLEVPARPASGQASGFLLAYQEARHFEPAFRTAEPERDAGRIGARQARAAYLPQLSYSRSGSLRRTRPWPVLRPTRRSGRRCCSYPPLLPGPRFRV